MTNPVERERIAREVAEELAREQFEKRYSWPEHLERNAAGDYTDYEVSTDWGGFRDGFLCASDAMIDARIAKLEELLRTMDFCVVCGPDPDHRHEEGCPILEHEREVLAIREKEPKV